MSKGLHEMLHDLQQEIYSEAEAITDLDDGKFFYNAQDREAIRAHAREILALVDRYEQLDAGSPPAA